jgi:hypothetical protein
MRGVHYGLRRPLTNLYLHETECHHGQYDEPRDEQA